MATNSASTYGKSIKCPQGDADALFSSTVGLPIVAQDLYHVLTTDDFLGPGGDARGYDVRKLAGMAMEDVNGLEPILEDVAKRDERLLTVTIVINATPPRFPGGPIEGTVSVTATTAQGPFSFVIPISEWTPSTFTTE